MKTALYIDKNKTLTAKKRRLKNENKKFKLSWWDVADEFPINGEDFVTDFLEKDWSEWKDDYLEYYCGENVGEDWIEEVKEFYADLDQQRTEREY